MLAFLKDQLKPGNRVAVFALTGPLTVFQDFTSDPGVLYAALQRYQPQIQEFTPTAPRKVNNVETTRAQRRH
jgi:hypothetical protein